MKSGCKRTPALGIEIHEPGAFQCSLVAVGPENISVTEQEEELVSRRLQLRVCLQRQVVEQPPMAAIQRPRPEVIAGRLSPSLTATDDECMRAVHLLR